jgi:hypothetical protein
LVVRSRRSSKLSKLSGPLTNSPIIFDFSAFTPGVTSTRTMARTSSGASPTNAMVVMPPSDIPMTALAFGASARIAVATSRALSV